MKIKTDDEIMAENRAIDKAFEVIRDIAQNYVNTHYPEAPDPMLYAIEIEKQLRAVELL